MMMMMRCLANKTTCKINNNKNTGVIYRPGWIALSWMCWSINWLPPLKNCKDWTEREQGPTKSRAKECVLHCISYYEHLLMLIHIIYQFIAGCSCVISSNFIEAHYLVRRLPLLYHLYIYIYIAIVEWLAGGRAKKENLKYANDIITPNSTGYRHNIQT